MQKINKILINDYYYFLIILVHIILGIIIFKFPFISKVYAFSILIFGISIIIKNRNKNNEVLYAVAYLIGSEVFLRMTKGNPNYEFAKYGAILLVLLGAYFEGISKKSLPYKIFILLLIPSVLITINTLDLATIKSKISFDISGPICLGFCSIYTYKKKINFNEINSILLTIGLPIISLCSYLFFKSPISYIDLRCTESNFKISGDFGPNQVATILGLGMFIFIFRTFQIPSSNRTFILNVLISSYMYYRGLLTFSRGGILTAGIIILIFIVFILTNKETYKAIKLKLLILSTFLLFVTGLTNFQTNGLLIKRYANKNVSGTDNNGNSKTGRKAIAIKEIKNFVENPIFGVGVGKKHEIHKSSETILSDISSKENLTTLDSKKVPENKKINNPNLNQAISPKIKKSIKLYMKSKINSHNEITRLLSEHGIFGLGALLILIITPILLYTQNKHNIYLICLFAFWFLTINHSATRIAASSFLYALALLIIDHKSDNPTILEKS